MTIYDLDDLQDRIRIRHGDLRQQPFSLYAIVKNEKFILESFLNHYRSIGVRQFLMLDDGSSDGTLEMLCEQPDCVVLSSPLSFGEILDVRMPDGQTRPVRWGATMKSVVPRKFLQGSYAIYVDADEFLILPRGLDLNAVVDVMRRDGIGSIAANLVEFYPQAIGDLEGEVAPRSLEDLLALYPCFDARPLLSVSSEGEIERLHYSASSRLFRHFGIGEDTTLTRLLRLVRIGRRQLSDKTAVSKTPIAYWDEGAWLKGSHRMNGPSSDRIVLTLAHFKFTHDFVRKIHEAMAWQAHSNKSAKYFAYDRLLRAMRRRNASFLAPESESYGGPEHLERVGLIKWQV